MDIQNSILPVRETPPRRRIPDHGQNENYHENGMVSVVPFQERYHPALQKSKQIKTMPEQQTARLPVSYERSHQS